MVVATDGMLDNIFDTDVAAAVTMLKRRNASCSDMAKELATLAHCNSLKSQGETPFAVGARKTGRHWDGGKIDDITVLVANVS